MNIILSGSTGMIGKALVAELRQAGHSVRRLVRSSQDLMDGDVLWNPDTSTLTVSELAGADAVIHLNGESIAAGRWTDAKKRRIRDSRVNSTQFLAESLTRMKQPPKMFFCASGIGYYGDRGDELLNEDSAPGTDFLADVCRAWEAATVPASRKGIRVVNLRFSMVLGSAGGALGKMLPPFKLGVGGKIGSGKQTMSWIALDDLVSAVQHILKTDSVRGPVNITSPGPVSNELFTQALGRALGRPTVFPMPAFAARLAFGEMADALLLSSQKVDPEKLKKSGFLFRHPELEEALRHVLNGSPLHAN